MRSTSIRWPVDDLGCPLRGAYSMTVMPRFTQSNITNGQGSYARFGVEEKRTIQVNFAWEAYQLEIFENFYNTDLLYGIRWFMFPMLIGGQMVDSYSHITDEWGVRVIKPQFFSVGIPMECIVKTALIP